MLLLLLLLLNKFEKVMLFFCVHVRLHSTWKQAFSSRRSHAVTAKKCTKKRDARAKLLFCQSKSIAVLPFSLTSPSSLLKLPIVHQSSYFITPHLSLRFNFCSSVVAALTKKWNESFSFCCLILFTFFCRQIFSFLPCSVGNKPLY